MEDGSLSYQSFSSTQRKILSYLRDEIKDGKIFFKSKHIAAELGYSSQKIGQNLKKLSKIEIESLTIERWSSGAKEITWKISANTKQLDTYID